MPRGSCGIAGVARGMCRSCRGITYSLVRFLAPIFSKRRTTQTPRNPFWKWNALDAFFTRKESSIGPKPSFSRRSKQKNVIRMPSPCLFTRIRSKFCSAVDAVSLMRSFFPWSCSGKRGSPTIVYQRAPKSYSGAAVSVRAIAQHDRCNIFQNRALLGNEDPCAFLESAVRGEAVYCQLLMLQGQAQKEVGIFGGWRVPGSGAILDLWCLPSVSAFVTGAVSLCHRHSTVVTLQRYSFFLVLWRV